MSHPVAERLKRIRLELDTLADTLTQPWARDLRRASEHCLHVEKHFAESHRSRR